MRVNSHGGVFGKDHQHVEVYVPPTSATSGVTPGDLSIADCSSDCELVAITWLSRVNVFFSGCFLVACLSAHPTVSAGDFTPAGADG